MVSEGFLGLVKQLQLFTVPTRVTVSPTLAWRMSTRRE
jgi:hypothetical protein